MSSKKHNIIIYQEILQTVVRKIQFLVNCSISPFKHLILVPPDNSAIIFFRQDKTLQATTLFKEIYVPIITSQQTYAGAL